MGGCESFLKRLGFIVIRTPTLWDRIGLTHGDIDTKYQNLIILESINTPIHEFTGF